MGSALEKKKKNMRRDGNLRAVNEQAATGGSDKGGVGRTSRKDPSGGSEHGGE